MSKGEIKYDAKPMEENLKTPGRVQPVQSQAAIRQKARPAASFAEGSAVWGLMMLLFLAPGFGIPLTAMMLGIGMGLGSISEKLSGIIGMFKYAGGIAWLDQDFIYSFLFSSL